MRRYASLVCFVLLVAPICFADKFRTSPDVHNTSCAYVTPPHVWFSSSWQQHKRRMEQDAEKIISTTRDGVTVQLRRHDDSLVLTVVDSSTGAYAGNLRFQERAVGAVIYTLQTYSDESKHVAPVDKAPAPK